MRVLIVHHGHLPRPDRPVTGGALRAWHHGEALRAAGHEVIWLSRAQDEPGGYASPVDLLRKARALQPDRVVAVQLEEASTLSHLDLPMAVDLYAPRVLEAPFEGRLSAEAPDLLRALAAGDTFLVSNPRQRFVWLGLLALAGLDTRQDPTLLVPLVAPEGPERRLPAEPVLVGGGASWPWQDPRPAIEAALGWLERRGRGRLIWYGGEPLAGPGRGTWSLPQHPRLGRPGWLPYDQLLQALSSASLALDWMVPNPERQAALSFRHVDCLGCGLPILTGADSALTDVLGDAGLALADLAALPAALDELTEAAELARRSEAARALARRLYSRDTCEAPLVAWVERARRLPRREGPLLEAARWQGRVEAAEARAGAAELRAAAAEAEVERKRQEVAALTALTQDQQGLAMRLARSLDEVAGFKREAIALLGQREELSRGQAREAERELAILRADLEKKSAELLAMDSLRARLENDLTHLRAELHRARQGGIFRRG